MELIVLPRHLIPSIMEPTPWIPIVGWHTQAVSSRGARGSAGSAIDQVELVANAETACMLGLTIPASLLAVADEVIE